MLVWNTWHLKLQTTLSMPREVNSADRVVQRLLALPRLPPFMSLCYLHSQMLPAEMLLRQAKMHAACSQLLLLLYCMCSQQKDGRDIYIRDIINAQVNVKQWLWISGAFFVISWKLMNSLPKIVMEFFHEVSLKNVQVLGYSSPQKSQRKSLTSNISHVIFTFTVCTKHAVSYSQPRIRVQIELISWLLAQTQVYCSGNSRNRYRHSGSWFKKLLVIWLQ